MGEFPDLQEQPLPIVAILRERSRVQKTGDVEPARRKPVVVTSGAGFLEHRVNLLDRLAKIPVLRRDRGELLHALTHPLHALRRRPALQEVATLLLGSPDLPRHALVQVTSEEVESVLSIGEFDLPRLLRVQLQPEALEDDLHAPFRFLDVRLGVAHDREVIGVPDERPQMGALLRPALVEERQIDIREQR